MPASLFIFVFILLGVIIYFAHVVCSWKRYKCVFRSTRFKVLKRNLETLEKELMEAQHLAHIGNWYWDAKTRILTGSEEFYHNYGIDPASETKPSFNEMRGVYYPEAEWVRLRDAVVETLKTGVGYELDLRAYRNGTPIWITTRSEVIRGKSGEIIALRGTEQDITDRKRLEEENQESERRYKHIVKFAPVAIFEIDILGTKLISVNDTTCNLLGYSKEELLQIQPLDLLDERGISVFKERMAKKLAGEKVEEYAEYNLKRKDGKWIIASMVIGDVTFKENEIPIVLAVGHDITERKFLENNLQSAVNTAVNDKNRLEAVFETAPVGLAFFDFHGELMRKNSMYAAIWGTSNPTNRTIKRSLDDHNTHRAWWADSGKPLDSLDWASAKAIREGKTTVGQEIRIKRYDGEIGYILNSATPVRDALGNITGCAVAIMDITDRKNSEDRLRNFVSVLSHEIRNPLSPILNEIELLKMKEDTPVEIRESVDIISRQVDTMVSLVKDLLDVSRVERGKITLNKSEIDLSESIRNAMVTTKPLIDVASQHITVSASEEPIHIFADPLRIEQIITNLLNNASKYSDRNSHIKIILEKTKENAVIRVVDNGVGIPSEAFESIFGLFTQNEKMSRLKGGLGVGLYLSRELARLHGGDVFVQSEGAGKGSEFTVILPLHQERTKE
jgi:PAS domain S-box-containing protein